MTETRTAVPAPRFADGDAMRVIGLCQRYTEATMDRIPEQWDRLHERLRDVEGRADPAQFGLHYARSRSPLAFDYVAGVMVEEGAALPDGFVERRILPRRHAVFAHRGPISGLRPLLHGIFAEWLPTSGHAAAGDPLFTEVYGEDFDTVRLEGLVEVWVPLKDR